MSAIDTLNLMMMEANITPGVCDLDTNTLVLTLTHTNLLALLAAASDITARFTDYSDFNISGFIEAVLDNLEWINNNIEGVKNG